MEGKRFIQSLKLQNILSYGPESEEIKLEPLNVLIGPNASGKSNLIEAIGLLQAAPSELTRAIRDGGGISEWLWKGSDKLPAAQVTAFINYQYSTALRYQIGFRMVNQRTEIANESVDLTDAALSSDESPVSLYLYAGGNDARLAVMMPLGDKKNRLSVRENRPISREEFNLQQSILSQRKDPDQYPELTYLSNEFSKLKIYREWNLGRNTSPRLPQSSDLPEDFLLENAQNLGLVLNELKNSPKQWRSLLENVQKFSEWIEDINVRIRGGTVQLSVQEKGLVESTPATRLSDGTLRWLCLLAVLCHPDPPPLICIEEPELGLHPDILPTLADLLIEASHRTQLIVTTHSDLLVSALSTVPEAVIICERDQDGTHLRRLERDQLKEWLEKYSLGQMWLMGELGGTRW